jgi:type I restriction enzyme, S subunit
MLKIKPYPEMKDSGVEWLGHVPEHWEILPNRTLFNEIKDSGYPDEEMLSVTIKKGVVKQTKLLEDSSKKDSSNLDKSKYKLLRPGDLAYNKMRAWQGAIGTSEFRGIISPAYVVQRPRDDESSLYFHNLFRTPSFAKEAERWSYGITSDMWSLRPEHFRLIYSCVPPRLEQAAIVKYLDYMDRRIKKLIAAKKKLIKLLEEQKQTIIHQAVTEGLDPDVPMKDSGVEWLGKVPEHWDVLKIGRLGRFQNGLNIDGDAFGSGDPFVSYGDVYNNANLPEVPNGLVQSTLEDQTKCSLKIGDVLFTRTSETADDIGVASTCLSLIPLSTFAGFLIRFRPNEDILEPRYSTYLFRNQGVHGHFAGTMNLVTRASLSQGVLKGLPICIPPAEEQHQIAVYIEAKVNLFRDLILRAKQEIDLLDEYSTSLIADVVTGKLDVRHND